MTETIKTHRNPFTVREVKYVDTVPQFLFLITDHPSFGTQSKTIGMFDDSVVDVGKVSRPSGFRVTNTGVCQIDEPLLKDVLIYSDPKTSNLHP